MRAYLIDPFARAVTEVELTDEIDDIYRLLGGIETFDAFELDEFERIFVDDNGLFVEPSMQQYYYFDSQLLAGRGLFLGQDEKGNSISPTSSLDEVARRINFADHATGVAYALQFWDVIPKDIQNA